MPTRATKSPATNPRALERRDCRPHAECETLVTVAQDEWPGEALRDGRERADSPVQLGERRRYLDVAEEVLRAVAIGTIGAGDRLPNERELAERCEVSRATVREAMLALELGGVVEVRPGSGTYLTGLGVPSANSVAPPVDSSPRELLHARQIIEPAVVQLCSMRIRAADVKRLERLVDEAQAESESAEPGRLDQFVSLSLAFHRELAACCGNSVLAGLTSHLVNAAEHPMWALVDGIVVRNPETRTCQLEEHRAILRAIARGHGAAAVTAMTTHLGALGNRLFGADGTPPKVSRARRRRSA
jgi:DNA-binding FadR family transcriptional regulator